MVTTGGAEPAVPGGSPERWELSEYRERMAPLSMVDRVAGALRDGIADGALIPGQRLAEDEIAHALGVSRNTLREAFRLLVRERLVRHEMNRGVFVRTPQHDDVRDVFGLRRIIEVAAIERSADSDLTAVLAAVERGEQAAATDDWSAVATADLQFHRAIAGLLRSERVNDLMNSSIAELRLVFHAAGPTRAFHEPYLARNRRIADLLAAGCQSAAVLELTSYLDKAEKEVLAALPSAGA
jgi:DNA-binding GntR family transcriptional regulator